MSLEGFPGWTVGPAGLVMIPLLAALLAFLLGRRSRPWLPFLTVLAMVSILVGATQEIWQSGPRYYPIGGWKAPLGIDLYMDGLALLMLWMTAAVAGAISVYALDYFPVEKADLFWPLWLLLWASLNALFLSADIFNLYVTLELTTLAAVGLVALAGNATALAAAMRYLLFALLGSFCYLLGVTLLYGGFGTLAMVQLGQMMTAGWLSGLAIVLITAGLLIKTAVFPLHVWLPPAHASAPAPVSAVLSALVVKASFYLLLRLWFWVFPAATTAAAQQALGVLGAAAILYGSFQALRQTRVKLLIAYSTVAQLGYLLLVFPLAGTLALNGAILQALSHALAKAALFLAAGNILLALTHDRIKELADLERHLPVTVFAFGLAGIGIMGLPPSGGFLAKWLLLRASLESGQWWWAPVILIGGLLAAGYVFRVIRYAFRQRTPAPVLQPHAVPTRAMELAPLLLALLALGLGLAGTPPLMLLSIGSPFPVGQ